MRGSGIVEGHGYHFIIIYNLGFNYQRDMLDFIFPKNALKLDINIHLIIESTM